jgi:pilus assembly protein CpaF
MENDIFQALDVGVLVRKRLGDRGIPIRYLDQVCFYLREKGKNRTEMIVFDGERIMTELPEAVMHLFRRAGIVDPFRSTTLEMVLLEGKEEYGVMSPGQMGGRL